jgi:hypothetical protein
VQRLSCVVGDRVVRDGSPFDARAEGREAVGEAAGVRPEIAAVIAEGLNPLSGGLAEVEAATLAGFYQKALPSTAARPDLAGRPFHSG